MDLFIHSKRRAFHRQLTAWKRRMGVLLATGARVMDRRGKSDGFGILMYHRITDPIKGLARPTWNVAPKKFQAQLAGLVKLGYIPQPLSKMLNWHREGREIPANWFVITFDDVYENVYTRAWPILKDMRMPATLFLATAYLDSNEPFPFDDWPHSGERNISPSHWKPISTWQCDEMQCSGLIELGAHTHTHQDFRGRPDDLYDDLKGCKDQLWGRFGVENPTFAFPYGTKSMGYSGPTLVPAVRRAGLVCSLTTEDEQVFSESDPYDWGRFTAEQEDTAMSLAAKLDGWFTCFKSMWNRCATPANLARQVLGKTP